jgi:exodeoxyribonuclease-3
MSLTFATWNVNGLRARQAQFLEWIGRDRPDVVGSQEIKASPEQLAAEVCALEGYWCYWHGAGGYSGVGLNLRRDTFPEEPRFFHPDFDHETRIVAAEIGGDEGLVLASVYVPNGGKNYDAKIRFLDALAQWADDLERSGRRLILGGDLNVARTDQDVHPKERKPGIIGQRSEERARFETLLSHGLVDVGRALDPDNDGLFTWWAPWRNMRQRNIGWRIDYVLASRPLAERAASSAVLADVGTSDHAPVVATFDLD